MPTATSTVVVNRPPQEVFAYLADVTRHAEWSPKAYRVENLSGPTAVGTTFTSFGWIPRDAEHRNDVEVTEYSPPTSLTLDATEQGQHFISRFVLTPEGGGTKVVRTTEMPKPKGFVGVLFPVLMAILVRPGIQKGMNQFKQRLETGAPGSPS